MQLIIARHGAALASAPSDAERALSAQGVQQAQALGAWLSDQLEDKVLLRCSPYRRAQQTALAVSDALGLVMPETFFPELQPSSDPKPALSLCAQANTSMIFVSHQPLVGTLLDYLVYEDDLPFFDTACAAILDSNIDGFAERGSMRLSQFFRPEG